jgi:hypothetical protein
MARIDADRRQLFDAQRMIIPTADAVSTLRKMSWFALDI